MCGQNEFTFYCSSINGYLDTKKLIIPDLFTFYCSSINGAAGQMCMTAISVFTFYCSSINGQTQRQLSLRQFDLHSTVVLLMEERQNPIRERFVYLHSTVVLLMEAWRAKTGGEEKGFTFYCSSINGQSFFGQSERQRLFTFYCSSING